MNLEEEMREAREKGLKDYRKIVDEQFKLLEDFAESQMTCANDLFEIADDLHDMFKSRIDNIVDKRDLELLSRVMTMQLMMQSGLALIAYKNTTYLKQITYEQLEIPFEIVTKAVAIIAELVPKLKSETRKIVEDKLGAIEKEVQRLKESKDKITLEISTDYDEALKELTRRIVEEKKAQKSYVG